MLMARTCSMGQAARIAGVQRPQADASTQGRVHKPEAARRMHIDELQLGRASMHVKSVGCGQLLELVVHIYTPCHTQLSHGGRQMDADACGKACAMCEADYAHVAALGQWSDATVGYTCESVQMNLGQATWRG